VVDPRTIDRTVIVAASRPVETEHTPPPYGPPTPTGLTTPQQWALYFSRKRRRQRLGVIPSTPQPAALYLSGLNQVTEGAAPGTVIGNLQVIGGTGTYTFTKTADPSSKFTLAAGVLSTAGTWDYEGATFYPVTISASNGVDPAIVRTINVRVVDIPAPVLTAPNAQPVSASSMNLFVTTDTDSGTLYAVVTNSGTPPSAAQVKAGQNHLGAAANAAVNQAVSTAGFKTLLASGLTTGIVYYTFFMHERSPAEQSVVAVTPYGLALT
jgi:hypothetical protein